MQKIKFTSIDQYHSCFPQNIQILLDEIRMIIKQAAPKATEVISYNMPAFKLNKVLVYYAANKQHIGFYPTSAPVEVFAKELAGFKTSKGAIQFPLDKPVPTVLVKKMVQYRVKADQEKTPKHLKKSF